MKAAAESYQNPENTYRSIEDEPIDRLFILNELITRGDITAEQISRLSHTDFETLREYQLWMLCHHKTIEETLLFKNSCNSANQRKPLGFCTLLVALEKISFNTLLTLSAEKITLISNLIALYLTDLISLEQINMVITINIDSEADESMNIIQHIFAQLTPDDIEFLRAWVYSDFYSLSTLNTESSQQLIDELLYSDASFCIECLINLMTHLKQSVSSAAASAHHTSELSTSNRSFQTPAYYSDSYGAMLSQLTTGDHIAVDMPLSAAVSVISTSSQSTNTNGSGAAASVSEEEDDSITPFSGLG